jgi:hypothetical protein
MTSKQTHTDLRLKGARPSHLTSSWDSGPLIIYPAYRDETQLLAGKRQSLALSAGVGGLTKSKVATLSATSIPGIGLPAVTAEFPDAADNAVNSDRAAGNVGLPVFGRFRVNGLPTQCALVDSRCKAARRSLRQESLR